MANQSNIVRILNWQNATSFVLCTPQCTNMAQQYTPRTLDTKNCFHANLVIKLWPKHDISVKYLKKLILYLGYNFVSTGGSCLSYT